MAGSSFVSSCALIFYLSVFGTWSDSLPKLLQDFMGRESQCANCLQASCDLTSQALPKIILVGESPKDSPREWMLDQARAGVFPVATEQTEMPFAPGFSEGQNTLVYNLESPVPHSISLSYETQDAVLWEKQLIGDVFEKTLSQIQTLPMHAHAFQKMSARPVLKTYPPDLRELIGKVQDLHLFDQLNLVTQRDVRRLISRAYFLFYMPPTKKSFLFELHKALITTANTQYLAELGGEELPFYAEKTQRVQIFGPSESKTVHQRVTIEARARDFAKSLLDLTCLYKGNYEHLGVVVSEDLVQEIARHLKQAANFDIRILQGEAAHASEIEGALQ